METFRDAQSAPCSGRDPAHACRTDITSERAVTRRSLLGVLGVGAGVAAAVAFGTAEGVPAHGTKTERDSAKKKRKAPPREEADSD
jgi:hypothetical protein